MINLLSYIGMSLQSEVCLWTLVGLIRNIFDATLFKTNANLKQVWQMTMPAELSCAVQRILRTMISGVMLVQCFTVYVFLAAYIVLLYPVFLEERPTLVLPWLLLAAIRRLLCELMSLAMGLGVCLMLGPARTACIKFVIKKIITIMPYFYMWMLVFSYYHALKIRSSFKTFSVVLPAVEHDYGLELAVRRRRTKSLFDETELRKKLVARLYGGRSTADCDDEVFTPRRKSELIVRMSQSTETETLLNSDTENASNMITAVPSGNSDQLWRAGTSEEFFNSEYFTPIPRDVDRVLDQFTMMMLRIGAYIKHKENASVTTFTSSTFLRADIKKDDDYNIESSKNTVQDNQNDFQSDGTIANDSINNTDPHKKSLEQNVNFDRFEIPEQPLIPSIMKLTPNNSSTVPSNDSKATNVQKSVSVELSAKPNTEKACCLKETKHDEFYEQSDSHITEKLNVTPSQTRLSDMLKLDTIQSEVHPRQAVIKDDLKKTHSLGLFRKNKTKLNTNKTYEGKKSINSESGVKINKTSQEITPTKELKSGHLRGKQKTTLKITRRGKNVVEKTLQESSADIYNTDDITQDNETQTAKSSQNK